MKNLNSITMLLALLIVLMGCKKETPACTIVFSEWEECSNNIQTRTYTSGPTGCAGAPPSDSIQRPCVLLPSVQIGNQTWTIENLDTANYRNGDPIPQVQDVIAWSILTTGAWCYYENKGENGTTYGRLYNCYAVNDPRGLAPNGYHIPTDKEWTTLTDYLGGESVAGIKMKSNSGWQNNGNGTNTSGFSGLSGGFRDYYGNFNSFGGNGYWWSSTEYDFNFAWYRFMGHNNGNVTRSYSNNRFGFSVRCVKD